MGTITALTTQVKNPDRVSVFLDGAFACGLALEVAAGLRVGQTITATDLAALEHREEVHHARERAVALLARRPRSATRLLATYVVISMRTTSSSRSSMT